MKNKLKGAACDLQHLLIFCIAFFYFGLNWRQKAFGKIQDGVLLKLKKNAQHPMSE
jgi:hypothetical protein